MCSGTKAVSRKENLSTDEPDAWARSLAILSAAEAGPLGQTSACGQTDAPANHLKALKLLS